MKLPRRLSRPDFESDEIGAIVDADYLPDDLKNRLCKMLPNQMAPERRDRFLSLVGQSLQMGGWLQQDSTTGAQLSQLERLESSARALLQAIRALSTETRANLRAHSATLAIGSSPPAHLSETGARVVKGSKTELFSYFWDAAQDVETASAHAAAYCKPSKTDRPSQSNSRRLTAYVAGNYYAVEGRLPPCSKGTWFPKFMSELGASAGYKIGLALVEKEFDRLKESNSFPASRIPE